MISKLQLENILFLDIETVPEVRHFSELDATKKVLWEHKSRYRRKDEYTAEAFFDRAGIWAEFGKVVCISVGYFDKRERGRSFRVMSFYGEEINLLKAFKKLINSHFNESKHLLCAHNGKEFDFPYIARRMIINNIALPKKLSLFGKKPWEIPHLDTLELWKFGDYKAYTSLKLLTHVLGIPSPKDDMEGCDVYRVYYEDKNMDKLVTYCEKDTVAVAQVLLRLRGEPLLADEDVVHIEAPLLDIEK